MCTHTQISVSHTTRQMRDGEVYGKDYFFISTSKFEDMIAQGDFLEYAKVFDHYYGTSRELINQTLSTGVDLFLDIDWQGAQQIRSQVHSTCSIFVLPPSREELRRRLRGRGKDNEEVITNRMSKAALEISHYSDYDYLVINDDFDIALSDLKTIIRAERMRVSRRIARNTTLISKLLTL